MSTDPTSAPAPGPAGRADDLNPVEDRGAAHASPVKDQIECAKQPPPVFLHSPPDSNNAAKTDDSDSELSDLEEEPILDDAAPPVGQSAPQPELPPAEPDAQQPQPKEEPEEDIGEVLPDHWSGAVPVFKPTMHQFKDFTRFMNKVNNYGMKSGIIKVIPPQEWKDKQPELDNLVKQIRVREPIKQDIMGSNGTYRQVNILHGRSYNLPQWRSLCEQSEHQPPARRGERRANADKPKAPRPRAPAAPKPSNPSTPKKRGRGRPKGKGKQGQKKADQEDRPMTPVSPKPEEARDEVVGSIENVADTNADTQDQPPAGRGGSKQGKQKTQSTSARRKYCRREGSAIIDEEAFKDFDYRMDISDYTPERCEELERAYWKTLTYAPPLYGADLMGTLFDDATESWNLSKLPNLLDVLGTKVPGVNTAYLYLGMWKATFAWHLEDVDLYSINYVHFGAPKQWYSISQADARRFEAAMKNIWPADAKACDQFLRHKAFLISPQHLLQNYGIKVNRVVSYPGEFVVTYPYGYHSGYNLGYNCAEAVNFALDSWLDMGKIAKKCECAQAQDSVWINVYEIERKLRGEETEYEETEEEEDDDDDDIVSGLPTPPASHGVKFKGAGRKRKRGPADRDTKMKKMKKIKLRLKPKSEPPCCLCPNDIPGIEILPTDDGRKAHRLCAIYLPETYVDLIDDKEVVSNAGSIHKDRLSLKCLYCRSKRGACFQCSQKKCARAYHATCGAAAGVFIEEQDVPVFGEDGTEYKEQALEFSCRYHRTKRDRKLDGDALESDSRIMAAAAALKVGDICQLQYYRSDIFAATVVENRLDEQTLLVDVIPSSDRVEVEWKWLLRADASDYHLPKASANAIPMPASRKAKDKLNAKRQDDEQPRKEDPFGEGLTWAEFNLHEVKNKEQAQVDFAKENQLWHYLGKTSTDAKAQYTDDHSNSTHNPKSNFLDTIPKPPKPAPAKARVQNQRPFAPVLAHSRPLMGANPQTATAATGRPDKPYVYKPRKPIEASFEPSRMYTPQRFAPTASAAASQSPHLHQQPKKPSVGHQNGDYTTQRFEAKPVQWASSQGPPTAGNNATRPPMPQPLPAALPASQQKPAPAAARQQNKPTWQIYQSAYQKYPFFQVHHNRDSTRYKTPYSPWGGFTNGYQGDLKAHLMANQGALLRQPSHTPIAPLGQASHGGPSPGYSSVYNSASPSPSPMQGSSHTAATNIPSVQHKTSMSPPVQTTPTGPPATPSTAPRPAAPLAHSQQQFQREPQQASGPKPGATAQGPKVGLPAAVSLSLKSTKPATQILPKQSPVPLPANFLAAMTSSPKTPASFAKPPPLQPAGAATSTPSSTPSQPQQTTGSPGDATMPQPEATPKTAVTPVPVPVYPRPASQQNTGPAAPSADAVGSQSGVGPAAVNSSTTSLPTPDQKGAECQQQDFPDVPGCESMEFAERLMRNLRRASLQEGLS